MTITPKQDVTINGITYKAESTYSVNYTIFTRMVESGAMNEFVSTSTADAPVVEKIETEKKPVRSSRRRTPKK